ncbi:MAG: hypothetical protein ACP5US_10230 [Candidatus Kryptoniota bacterium]
MGDMDGYTTIMIDNELKRVLDILRKRDGRKESYNDAIRRLLALTFLNQGFEFVGIENNSLKYRTNKAPEEIMNILVEMEKLGYLCNMEVSDAVYVELTPR